jgi:hypothetical protein
MWLLPLLQPQIDALLPGATVTVTSCDALWFPISKRANVYYEGRAEMGRRWVTVRITDFAQNGCVTSSADLLVLDADSYLTQRTIENRYRTQIEHKSLALNDTTLAHLQKTDASWLQHCASLPKIKIDWDDDKWWVH